MQFKNFTEAENYLNSFIHSNLKKVFDENNPLARTRTLAKKVGDPHKKLKIIHIAGTSGKGSTSKLTSESLQSQGFKVGLVVSPHLKTIRERIQLNSNLISENDFIQFLSNISFAIEEVKKEGAIAEACICYTGDITDPKKTKFHKFDKITPGTMIIFYSGLWHRVLPVKTGFRKSLVGWTLGTKFQ